MVKKGLACEVVQEKDFPSKMSNDLLERWADGIPVYSENDPSLPEWKETPVFQLDLSSDGYETVHVKNEADKASNPTGTIKDRPAWELAAIYRDYAISLTLRKINGNIMRCKVPRFTYITAGNVGRAVSNMFEKYGLPPMKLLVDFSISEDKLKRLKELYAEIYMTDLSKRLSAEDIKKLTRNEDGIDVTSVKIIRPQEIFYDWHVHETFNQNPDQIYVPFGSGRLYENYLTWQEKSLRQGISGNQDPRLKISLERVVGIDVLAAKPERLDSQADKLTTRHNPFKIFDDNDISALKILQFSGVETGVYKVKEEYIRKAYEMLKRYCETEPSGAVGLALYLQRYDEGRINLRDRILIINTGKGNFVDVNVKVSEVRRK